MNLKIIVFLVCIIALVVGIIYSRKRIEIKLGLLYTTSGGEMASDELNCYNMAKKTIEHFNNLQSKFKLVVSDFNPQSNTELYQQGAEQLLSEEDMTMVIGCWRSIDRKAVTPIFEKYNNLLNYCVQYEGQECSANTLYFGACPNQQVNVGIEYAIKNLSESVILIGSDYNFPRIANGIMKNYITNYNASLLLEEYIPLGSNPEVLDSICENIVNISLNSNGKCVILNTINGDLNYHFFKILNSKFKSNDKYKYSIRSDVLPIVSFSVTEEQLQNIPVEFVYGDYHVWNYSQKDISYDLYLKSRMESNNKILNKMIDQFKSYTEIIGDPSYHSYLAVLFFCEFLLNSNLKNYDSKIIRETYRSRKNVDVLTSTGYLQINKNNHLDNVVFILKINIEGHYNTVFKSSSRVSPNPWYDRFSDTNYECSVEDFRGNKYSTLSD